MSGGTLFTGGHYSLRQCVGLFTGGHYSLRQCVGFWIGLIPGLTNRNGFLSSLFQMAWMILSHVMMSEETQTAILLCKFISLECTKQHAVLMQPFELFSLDLVLG